MSVTTQNVLTRAVRNLHAVNVITSQYIGPLFSIRETDADINLLETEYDALINVTVVNTGASTIEVTTTDLGEDATHYVYVNHSPTITISAGHKRNFIRVMYSPSVWEPSAEQIA